MLITAGKVGDQVRGTCDVALADVEQDQNRLLRQEAESADALLLVLGQLYVADRLAFTQRGDDLLEHRELTLFRLPLGRRPVPSLRLEPLDALLDHRQVREAEFEIEPLDVAPG